MKTSRNGILSIVFLFIFINAFLLTAKSLFAKYGLDRQILIVANIIFFVINVVAYFIQSRSLKSKNPAAFIRAVMGGIMLKMLICIFTIFIYVSIAKNINKPSIIAAMVLYVLYMAVEIAAILKLNKQKNG